MDLLSLADPLWTVRQASAWLAVTEQVPAATTFTAEPLTVQTAGVVDAKVTTRPEVGVAASVRGSSPTLRSVSAGKLIDCARGCARGCASDCVLPPPPQAPSATLATRAQAHNWMSRTAWLMTCFRKAISSLKSLSWLREPLALSMG